MKVVIELTDYEVWAVSMAVTETIDSANDMEQRAVFGSLRRANAAKRAEGKMIRAILLARARRV